MHLDLLARLHRLVGSFAVLCGVSLAILATGTSVGLRSLASAGSAGQTGVMILAVCAVVATAAGLAMIAAGRALAGRSAAGRLGALMLAVPTLVVVPFGTALSVYAFWVLLNDEARSEFGRPPRTPARPV